MAGARRLGRRRARELCRRRAPLHRHRLGGRGRASTRRDRRAARLPQRRVPRDRARPLRGARWVRGRLLPLPRGCRPLAARAARGRCDRRVRGGGRRPRLRLRQGRCQVAPPRAEPLGDDRPDVSGGTARPAGSGAPRRRARDRARVASRRVVAPEAPRRRRQRRAPARLVPRAPPHSARAHALGLALRRRRWSPRSTRSTSARSRAPRSWRQPCGRTGVPSAPCSECGSSTRPFRAGPPEPSGR